MRMRFVLGAAVLLGAAMPGVSAADSIAKELVSESDGSGMSIASDPSGADLYVNGVLRGKTPIELKDLIPGQQILRLEKDGYVTLKAVVTVPVSRHLSVFFELTEATGILRVEAVSSLSAPMVSSSSLRIMIDGNPASLGDNAVKEGFHTVRLSAFGFESVTRTVYVYRSRTETLRVELQAAAFRLGSPRFSRKRFNPRDPGLLGNTNLDFAVSAPGTADVSIHAADGTVVFRTTIPSFTIWEQSVAWNGRTADGTPLPDGAYTALVAARAENGDAEQTAEARTVIDSEISVAPASISGGIGGSLFSPDARTLPEGSFQIDTSVLFGRPYGSDGAFGAPPFAFGARFAPLDGETEAVAAFMFDAAKTGQALSFAASVKRALFSARRSRVFAAAAAVRWAYSENSQSAFGAPSGAELFLPMEASIVRTETAEFYLNLTPSLLWAGTRGIPASAAPYPVAGAGFGVRGPWYSAALSLRAESRYENESLSLGPMLVGCEARFNPPPSVFYFRLLSGFWRTPDASSFFGGAGLGYLY